jgi:hypothetical protein
MFRFCFSHLQGTSGTSKNQRYSYTSVLDYSIRCRLQLIIFHLPHFWPKYLNCKELVCVPALRLLDARLRGAITNVQNVQLEVNNICQAEWNASPMLFVPVLLNNL